VGGKHGGLRVDFPGSFIVWEQFTLSMLAHGF
jgi:hypothetical protein